MLVKSIPPRAALGVLEGPGSMSFVLRGYVYGGGFIGVQEAESRAGKFSDR